MSTLLEIERAIETLPEREVVELEAWFQRRKKPREWPVPPPNVPREELARVHAEIEAAFPMRRAAK